MKKETLFVSLELKDVETVKEKIKGELIRKKSLKKAVGLVEGIKNTYEWQKIHE